MLEPAWITEEHTTGAIDLDLQLDPFRGGRGRGHVRGVLHNLAEVYECRFDPELPGQDTCGIEQICDELTLKLRIVVDGFCRSLSKFIWKNSKPQHVRPSQQRIQWRSQLVGDRHQELVLQAIVGLGFASQLLFAIQCLVQFCSPRRDAGIKVFVRAPQNVFNVVPFSVITNHKAEHPNEQHGRTDCQGD